MWFLLSSTIVKLEHVGTVDADVGAWTSLRGQDNDRVIPGERTVDGTLTCGDESKVWRRSQIR